MGNRLALIILIFILALGAFFRFYLITEIPPGLYPDEAMNGNNALEALATGDFKIFYPENNGREGLFINIQAISIWLFENAPWALRLVSAIFGTLTILGVYLLTKELFYQNFKFSILNFKSVSNNSIFKRFIIENHEVMALLAAFFTATSFWHINFSRIGFRAIVVPFLATFGIYFLLKGLRRGKISDIVFAGIFIGLGFHTYIAFRFVPFVLAVPIFFALISWWRGNKDLGSKSCAPCAIVLFLFVIFIVALPIGWYFLQNPADFLGRGGQVSIFADESPAFEFLKSNLATLGMFFYKGDCNWRHNFACQPELHPIVAFFFLIGLLNLVYSFFKKSSFLSPLSSFLLATWLFFLSLPATLTKEGLPHALRTIGMIPPVMILSGLGAYAFMHKIIALLEKAKIKWPEISQKATRLQREFQFLVIFVLLFLPIFTYRDYILRWSNHPNTYFSFATDMWHAGQFLDRLPKETYKYVIVNLSGTEVRGIPTPAQTVMFATDTFREEKRLERNITYLLPEEINTKINPPDGARVIIMPLNGNDDSTKQKIREKFPDYEFKAPLDFVIFSNYYRFE